MNIHIQPNLGLLAAQDTDNHCVNTQVQPTYSLNTDPVSHERSGNMQLELLSRSTDLALWLNDDIQRVANYRLRAAF